jgi:hypothetical protein
MGRNASLGEGFYMGKEENGALRASERLKLR